MISDELFDHVSLIKGSHRAHMNSFGKWCVSHINLYASKAGWLSYLYVLPCTGHSTLEIFGDYIDQRRAPIVQSHGSVFSTSVRNKILCASEAELLTLVNWFSLSFPFFIELNCHHVKTYTHSLIHSFNKYLLNHYCSPGTMDVRDMPSEGRSRTARFKKKKDITQKKNTKLHNVAITARCETPWYWGLFWGSRQARAGAKSV